MRSFPRASRRATAALSLAVLAAAALPGCPALAAPVPGADTQTAPAPADDTIEVLPPQGAPARYEDHDRVTPGIPAPAPGTMAPRAVQQLAGTVQVTLVTVQTADKTAADTAAINVGAAQSAIRATNDYWRTMSGGRLGLNLANTITGFHSAAHSDFTMGDVMSQVKNELGWQAGPYRALVIVIPADGLVSGNTTGNQGGGHSFGNGSGMVLLPYTSGFTPNALSHEFGHVFGLMHANSLMCLDGAGDSGETGHSYTDGNCVGREYGDSTSVMGVSQYAVPYLNSYLLDHGRLGRGDEIADGGVVEGVRGFILKAWADTSQSNRAVKFRDPISGETYYLQVRLPVGYDANTARGGNRGVEFLKAAASEKSASLLIAPSTAPFAGWYNPNHAWQAGSVFTTWTGTQVHIDWISDNQAGITVTTPFTANPNGSILQKYLQIGAVYSGLGRPTSNETGGLIRGGAFQDFQGGSIVWSPASGTHVSGGAIRAKWQDTGFENGGLGYPTTDETGGLIRGGTYQNYQGGAIMWSPATGAHVSAGAIRDLWAKTGFERGGLGYPTSDEVGRLPQGGVFQNYEGGAIVWTPALGAHLSAGSIRSAWAATGFEQGGLGYPTSNEYAIPGGVAQDYQGGTITDTQAGGVRIIAGAIGAKYRTTKTALGYATSPSVKLPDGGYYQNFQHGAILWSAATGAHLSTGATRTAWAATGFEAGKLGYPTTDPVTSSSGAVTQDYQGGTITIPKTGPAVITYKQNPTPAPTGAPTPVSSPSPAK